MKRLSALLAPVDAESFRQELWDQRPLHVPGERSKWELLLSSDVLDPGFFEYAVANLKRTGLTAFAYFALGNEEEFFLKLGPQRLNLDSPSDVMRALAMGATVAVSGVESLSESLSRTAMQIKRELSFVGQVKCSLWRSPCSPISSLPAHIDPGSNIFRIQLAGSRCWHLSERAHPESTRFSAGRCESGNRVILRERKDGAVVQGTGASLSLSLTLNPGDLLYLPGGVWHTTSSVGDGDSIALNFSYQDGSLSSFLTYIVESLLSDASLDGALVCEPPLDGGRMPDVVQDALRFGLTSLRQKLDGLSDTELEALWHGRIAKQRVAEPKYLRRRAESRLTPKTQLRTNPATAIRYVVSGNHSFVFHGNSLQRIRSEFLPLVAEMVEREQFVAHEAIEWTGQSWIDVMKVLSTFLEHGILRIDYS